jgi:hypothetical protein
MKYLLTRRNILIGAGGAVVLAGGAYETSRLLGNRPTPFDDLLNRLEDRDGGIEIGKSVLAEAEEFDPKTVAESLRTKLGQSTLAQAAVEDSAAGRLVEAGGWVVPECVALLCALAAKAA